MQGSSLRVGVVAKMGQGSVFWRICSFFRPGFHEHLPVPQVAITWQSGQQSSDWNAVPPHRNPSGGPDSLWWLQLQRRGQVDRGQHWNVICAEMEGIRQNTHVWCQPRGPHFYGSTACHKAPEVQGWPHSRSTQAQTANNRKYY